MEDEKRKKKKRTDETPETGGNPNVPAGAFGGADDYRLGRVINAFNQQGTVPEETRSDYALAKAKIEDPVRYEQQQHQARLARDPWGPGGQFEGRRAADLYTPEQILASQGRTAENQLRSQQKPITEEQKAAGEFDPEELKRLNEQYLAMRSYT